MKSYNDSLTIEKHFTPGELYSIENLSIFNLNENFYEMFYEKTILLFLYKKKVSRGANLIFLYNNQKYSLWFLDDEQSNKFNLKIISLLPKFI